MVKKGQTAGGAAALVILVGLVIILYILFLPPADRAALLNEINGSSYSSTVTDTSDFLLNEHPRTLYPDSQDVITHELNTVTLYSNKEDALLKEYNNIYVFSSKTDKKVFEDSFIFDSIYTFTNPVLILENVNSNSPLIVYFNGKEVYSGTPKKNSIVKIKLDSVGRENKIFIETPDPSWWQFFSYNKASIGSVKLLATVNNNELLQSEQSFSVSQGEYDNFNTGYVKFLLSCTSKPSKLVVRLNEFLLSNAIFDCNQPVKLEFDKSSLIPGKNIISFKILDGVATIDRPVVKTILEKKVRPVYYFSLTEEQYSELKEGSKIAYLELNFVRNKDIYDLNVNINGKIFNIRSYDTNYKEDISRFLLEGENYIILAPRTKVDVKDLFVYLKPKV